MNITLPTHQSIAAASLLKLLGLWPHKSMQDNHPSSENGRMEDLTANMHEFDWAEPAKTMDAFDHKTSRRNFYSMI